MTGVLWLAAATAFAGKADKGDKHDKHDDHESTGGHAVGGSLAGWGAVPIADHDERVDGTTHLWGQVQVWTTLWDQDVAEQADPATYGDPEADPGFALRRARLGFDGFVPMGDRAGKSQVDYALSVGIGAPYDVLSDRETRLEFVDAFGRWALPTDVGVTSLAVGLQRVPFSRESMISSADLVFEEDAVSTQWMAPAREVGATGSQSFSLGDDPDGAQILLRLGAFDGTGDLFGASGNGLLGVGRLELVVGDAYRTWSPKKENALGVGVAAVRQDDVATRTDSIEADLLGRVSVLTVMGELVSAKIQPTNTDVKDPDVVADTPRLGWLAQASVWAGIDGNQGVEVAARYSSFDDDLDLDNNGQVQILTAGATWRNVAPRVDLGAGYVHRNEPAGIPNDTIRIWTQIRPEGNVGR
jgi:hypothetical protein